MLCRSHMCVKGQGRHVKKCDFALVYLTCDLRVKDSRVKGHMSQGQRSNEGSEQRQVSSHQHQVASLLIYSKLIH